MKTISTTLAILLTTLAPFAVGCAVQAGDEPSATEAEAVMNNGGAPKGHDLDDLIGAGYTCVYTGPGPYPLECSSATGPNVFNCSPVTHLCVPAPSTEWKPLPPIVIHRPIDGHIKDLE